MKRCADKNPHNWTWRLNKKDGSSQLRRLPQLLIELACQPPTTSACWANIFDVGPASSRSWRPDLDDWVASVISRLYMGQAMYNFLANVKRLYLVRSVQYCVLLSEGVPVAAPGSRDGLRKRACDPGALPAFVTRRAPNYHSFTAPGHSIWAADEKGVQEAERGMPHRVLRQAVMERQAGPAAGRGAVQEMSVVLKAYQQRR